MKIVAKKSIPDANYPDAEVAKLQAELEKAHESIKKLQRRNSELQRRIVVLENKPRSLPAQKLRMTRQERLLFRRRAAKRKRLLRLAISSSILLLGIGGIAIALNRWFFSSPVPSPATFNNVKASTLPTPTPTPTPTPLTRATLVYKPTDPPSFKPSSDLQQIVDSAVRLAERDGLPVHKLAITLIDAQTGEIAGYLQDEPRYPASVVKMFWLVDFYAQKEAGIITEDPVSKDQIEDAIENSDNDDAAFVLDKISGVKTQPFLSPNKFEKWLENRRQVNNFFTKAGYKNINIINKTYPVYAQDMESPEGTELQIREVDELPNANQITTDHAARLIYEICFTKQAVSSTASTAMCNLLTRDLAPEAWKKQAKEGGFHPIYGLLGEAFPNAAVTFASKAGGTSTSRQDAAFIQTEDGKVAYALAVFGNDGAYAGNGRIFPKISRLVFEKMKARTSS